ncbi:MAG: pseudouridine synthase [bacterium]|nr:pseudouridine synthase [bacterium]
MLSTAKINLSDLIIYEDEDVLVINKPAGLIINQAETHQQTSLQTLVASYLQTQTTPTTESYLELPTDFDVTYGTPAEIWQQRQGMVHRLDKDTSGLTVWAKSPLALVNLLSQFKNRTVNKSYLCLVHGLFAQEKSGRINLPLGRKLTNRQLMTVTPSGRSALTLYQVKQEWREFDKQKLKTLIPDIKNKEIDKLYQGFSLIKATPKTGRTHQIRAHLTHLKHPLVGDQAYLSNRKAKLDVLWCSRQFLHAAELSFTQPRTQKVLTFDSPLPTDLQTALTFLKN